MAVYFFTNLGDVASNALPPDTATRFGGAPIATAAVARDAGNIYRNSPNPGVSPSTINGDYVVDVFKIPGGSLDQVGRGLNIVAAGNVAANTNSKRIKIWWNATTPVVGSLVSGGTLLADTGAYTTNLATAYQLSGNVFKTGVLNQQSLIHETAQVGLQIGALVPCSVVTVTEASDIWIAITANAVTTTTDIVHFLTEVYGMN